MKKTWSRGLAIASVSLAAVAVLTGCVRLGVDIEISASDEVSGSVVIAALDSFSDVVVDGEDWNRLLASYTSVPGARESGYDQDGYRGTEVSFDGVPIGDFSNPSVGPAPIVIVREGDRLEVEGSFDFSAFSPEDFGDAGTFTTRTVATDELGELYVRMTFPGEIVSTNGVIDELTNTISWRLRAGEPNQIRASVLSPPPSSWWIWGLGLGGVGLLAGGLTAWALKKRPAAASPPPGRPGPQEL